MDCGKNSVHAFEWNPEEEEVQVSLEITNIRKIDTGQYKSIPILKKNEASDAIGGWSEAWGLGGGMPGFAGI